MICIKAFEKDLICQGFRYEVGKEYTLPREKIKICKFGFHAANGTDISKTLCYYPLRMKPEYALVDINVIDKDKDKDKVVGDKIKILRKIESLDELISYDQTGEWCYEKAKEVKDIKIIEKLENAVIKKDKTGQWCCNFASFIKNANIRELQKAVIEKDKTGQWCYYFTEVENADIEELQKAVIEKDKTGEWCYWFAYSVEKANIERLKDAVISKDQTGEFCYYFSLRFPEINKKRLLKVLVDKAINTRNYHWLIKACSI